MALTRCYRMGYEGRSGWSISFEYNAETVERLKELIPHTDRAWGPETKQWWIAAEYEDVILELFPDFELFLTQPTLFDVGM